MTLLASVLFDDLFHLKLPVLEKVLRPIIVYFALILLLRIFGKRELAQLNPFDLVVLLSVSNTVQNAIIGDDNTLVGGLMGALTLFAINYLTVRFLFRHRNWHEVLGGSPTKLVERGRVCKDALAKEMLTENELLAVAHRQGFDDVDEIEECVLEPGGTFFIKRKQPAQDDRDHAEVMAQLAEIRERVDLLGRAMEKRVN
jgi:uncharacterized membrane protein YcaP (DUF421 family)